MTETQQQKADRFKRLCISILAQSGNCEASQHDFNATDSIQSMCAVWRKYWQGLMNEVPDQVIAAFREFYPDFKTEINDAGIYYNEDARLGIVLIGDSDTPITLNFAKDAYILRKATVILRNNASAICRHPEATVELYNSSRATVQQGHGIARDRSTLTTCCDAECYNSSTVRITNATLTDRGHLAIYAYGTAKVNTFTDKGVTLYDTATIEIA